MKTKFILILVCIASMLFLEACSYNGENPYKNSIAIQKNISFGSVNSPDLIRKTITLKNIGNYELEVSNQDISSDDFIMFTEHNNTILKPQDELLIHIIFTPTSIGLKTIQVNMNEWIKLYNNQPNSYNKNIEFIDTTTEDIFDGVISISGELLKYPIIKIEGIDNNSLDFGTVELNKSYNKDIIIVNEGENDLNISDAKIIGYNQSFNIINNSCIGKIAPNQCCKLSIENKMTTVGMQLAELHIYSNSIINSHQVIELKSQGYDNNIDLSDKFIKYDDTKVGATQSKILTITNKGSQINFLDIKSGSDSFSIRDNTCQNILDTNQSCQITIDFSPIQAIIYTGELSIKGKNSITNDEVNINIALSGSGIIGELSFLDDEINYGQIIKGKDKTKSIQIKNTGKFPVKINNIDINQTFKNYSIIKNNCTNILNYNDICSIDVNFKPQYYGKDTATLNIQNDSINSQISVILTGIGIGTELLTDSVIDFGKTKYKVTKKTEIKNIGYDTINFSDVSIIDNTFFKIQKNTCSQIKSNEKCFLEIEFTPPYSHKVTDKVKLMYNDDKELYITLQGEGISPQADISTKNNIDFGTAPILSNLKKDIIITNLGYDDLLINNIKLIGKEFSITPSSCHSLSYNEKCTLTISYAPKTTGTHTGTLTFDTNDSNIPNYKIDLKGKAIYKGAYIDVPDTFELNGLPGSEQKLYISNKGDQPLSISNIRVNYDQYGSQIISDNVNSCIGELEPKQSCYITFYISGNGNGFFDMDIDSNAVNGYSKKVLINYNL